MIEVSLESLTPAAFISASGQLGHTATLQGKSIVPELCFTETVYVVDESLRNMKRLQKHGSVVVGLSDRWKYDYDSVGGWLQHVFDEVVGVVSKLPENGKEEDLMQHGYDQALAAQILEVLNEIYPASLPSPADLKHRLDNEPDHRTLMTALDALLGDGLISGKSIRGHTSGESELAMLAAIQITRQGRQSLEPPSASPLNPSAVVHGDQFINYGNLGAAGRNSTGSVVLGESWSQRDALTALDDLLLRLQQYPTQTPDLERAQREFHKVRDEVADELNPDKISLAKWLSRGKQLLTVAALSQEVFEAAHTVYKLFGV